MPFKGFTNLHAHLFFVGAFLRETREMRQVRGKNDSQDPLSDPDQTDPGPRGCSFLQALGLISVPGFHCSHQEQGEHRKGQHHGHENGRLFLRNPFGKIHHVQYGKINAIQSSKSTIFLWAIFSSKLLVYQRITTGLGNDVTQISLRPP